MNKGSINLLQNKTDYKHLLRPYTKNWKWFLISIIIAVIIGVLKIRYTVPEYALQAKIQILDDQSSTSELDLFRDLNVLGGGKSNIDDEIEILNSRSNLIQVIKQLGLNKKIIALGKIQNSDLYKNSPFNISFIAPDSIVFNSNEDFFITLKSNTSFELANSEEEPPKVHLFGKTISTSVGEVVITPNDLDLKNFFGKKYKIVVSPLGQVAELYQRKIQVSASKEFSNIITITLNDALRQRGEDILNFLITNYNKNAVDDKKAIANRTSDFIDDRIANIYGDLSNVDESAEEFKSGRGLTDMAAQTNLNLNIGAANQQELQNVSIQLDIASSMKDIVENKEGYDLLPSNIGLSDASIAGTTARYNELALQRKRLLESSNEKNPIIVNLDQQLDGLKSSMQSSLKSVTNNLGLQVNSLSSQMSRINSKIYSTPKNERALRDITRQQQTTESLYLYLLQKREESQITFASSTPKSKIIDNAYLVNKDPVSPKKSLLLLASLVLGFAFPFAIVYIKDLFDNKVQNKVSLEKLVLDVPVLAELPSLSKNESALILKDDRSVMAESLRILRTNLDYIIRSKNSNSKNNIIFITSSISGEGKSFLSSNLATIFANTNKKVLLIGADIRNPKLHSFFKSKNINEKGNIGNINQFGLTEFLYDHTVGIKDIINPMLVHSNNIDVIYSGKIPPNPSELLMSKRLKSLFDEVSENYDYVIVDTAPLLVVADTLLISQYADHIIYLTRAGVTEKKVLEYPLKLKAEGKLNNLSFVVNDVKTINLGYGGKYGYGYGKTIKKWWKF